MELTPTEYGDLRQALGQILQRLDAIESRQELQAEALGKVQKDINEMAIADAQRDTKVGALWVLGGLVLGAIFSWIEKVLLK